MAALKVPCAIDSEGNISYPCDSERGNVYFCPACGCRVILRKGSVKTAHFAHDRDAVCAQETILHKTAKLLIQKAVRDWKKGEGERPAFVRACQICSGKAEQPVPDKVDDALLEYRLPNGYVVDVALMVNGEVEAAVEVHVTHAVDETKAQGLFIPFLEVSGLAVVEDPYRWVSLLDYFQPITCRNCRITFDKFQLKTKELAHRAGIVLPSSYYRYGICQCWKCNREILVFDWPERGWSQAKPLQMPVPKTIQYRYSKTVNQKYWVNTCSYCHSIQGDFYLGNVFYIDSDLQDSSPESFIKDLMKIALNAAYEGLL